jgi:DNA-binding NtrC family response regulator
MKNYDRINTILVIDDEPGIHKSLEYLLKPEYSMHTALSGIEGIRKAKDISPDLILLDVIMPQMSGMEVLKKLKQLENDIPVIIFTGHGSIDSAIQAIKLGAADYIEKPFDGCKLKQIVKECIEKKKSSQNLSNRQDIIGESPQIKKVWQKVERYGITDLPILLYGESGTGKELFAKAIHEISKRRQGPMVPFDCSIIPEALFESELFGYEKGAFTGANIHKPGHMLLADKGTFFLDEISNLPLQYQAKLLRVIQERQYTPLGATTSKTVDLRFISSSNVNLEKAIQNGSFRSDLYYRISGVCIEIPPLREREGDIELLIRHFVSKYALLLNKPNLEISDTTMELLLSYPWPGNVRQLNHAIHAAVASADLVVLPDHFPTIQKILCSSAIQRIPDSNTIQRASDREKENGEVTFNMNISCDVTKQINLKDLEKKLTTKFEDSIIIEIQKRFALNRTELAKFLGIDPKTLRARQMEF